MSKADKPNIFRHGEIMLVAVKDIPSGEAQKHRSFIIGHSETGHHHVLESTAPFEVTEDEKHELYLRLFEPAKLVHQKAADKHRTLTIPAGVYKRYQDTEYDPFSGLINRVKD